MDMNVLREAKAAQAERLTAIALRHVPEGWTVTYRRSLTGRCYDSAKLIEAPKPVTRRAMHIFLHECGHAHLHPNTRPRYYQEYEAEQFAFTIMREYKIAIPRSSTELAKSYIRRKINQALRRGAKNIDAQVRKWSGHD